MSSIQSLRLSVELLVSQNQIQDDDEARKILSRYVSVKRSLAIRMTRCIFYLRKGYRSEAIRLKDIEPDLFVSLAELEFQDRKTQKAVHSLCNKYDLELPEVPLDFTDELLEGAQVDQRIKVLTETLRRYCLTKRPAERRAEVLTSLCKLEPDNPVWQANLNDL